MNRKTDGGIRDVIRLYAPQSGLASPFAKASNNNRSSFYTSVIKDIFQFHFPEQPIYIEIRVEKPHDLRAPFFRIEIAYRRKSGDRPLARRLAVLIRRADEIAARKAAGDARFHAAVYAYVVVVDFDAR